MSARCDYKDCPGNVGGMLVCTKCGHDPLELHRLQPFVKGAKFQVGDLVEKFKGDYQGPGEVRAVWTLWHEGPVRYCVTHKIEGGGGVIAHIYSEAQIRERTNDESTRLGGC